MTHRATTSLQRAGHHEPRRFYRVQSAPLIDRQSNGKGKKFWSAFLHLEMLRESRILVSVAFLVSQYSIGSMLCVGQLVP